MTVLVGNRTVYSQQFFVAAIAAIIVLFGRAQAQAQDEATKTVGQIERTVLPIPEPAFGGKIGRTYLESTPDYQSQPGAPEGAPNVLVIMLDDLGFAQLECYGGPIPTPNLNRLAQGGLRYNRFHVTALCSPTRAAFLTGRTHHQCGMGVITELFTGYPGYQGRIPKSCAMVSDVLRYNGYSTAAFGKWHLAPAAETGPFGPFDRWPTGQGFEDFYGFIGGETSQYEPVLNENTKPVHPAHSEDYHLTVDIADRAANWMKTHHGVEADKPFFIYWATGATHAPHHAPQEWIKKFKGKFDDGYDVYREKALARQLKLGIVPPGTKLAGRPQDIKPWQDLNADQKKLYARMMEVFAGFLAHTDNQIGRLLDALDETGQIDNTLIIALSDNGASAEGGLNGILNTSQYRNGEPTTMEESLAQLDEIGGPSTDNNYPAGWAWAGNAPFNYFKQAQHRGGTCVPLILHWPAKIKDKGGIRSQFHYVTDIAPTIFEAAGIPAPVSVGGVHQQPWEGVSLGYTFEDAVAQDRRTLQYFEMLGHRAIYQDGWYAVTFHGRLPWQPTADFKEFDEDKWELYNIKRDFGQADDLAANEPKLLRRLQDLWWAEASRNKALPLDDRMFARAMDRRATEVKPDSYTFYRGTGPMPAEVAPNIKNRSHEITVEVTVPEGGGDGILVSKGGTPAGYVMYFDAGNVAYRYNYLQRKTISITSSEPLSPGRHTITYRFVAAQNGKAGTGGKGALEVDGKPVGEATFEKTIPLSFSSDETMDIGEEFGSPVLPMYSKKLPFRFNGEIHRVKVELQ